MYSSIFLLAVGLIGTAIAESYNYARGLGLATSNDELQERAVYNNKDDEVIQFIRSLDGNEITELYRRRFLIGNPEKMLEEMKKKLKKNKGGRGKSEKGRKLSNPLKKIKSLGGGKLCPCKRDLYRRRFLLGNPKKMLEEMKKKLKKNKGRGGKNGKGRKPSKPLPKILGGKLCKCQ